jgi:hypothetical protein
MFMFIKVQGQINKPIHEKKPTTESYAGWYLLSAEIAIVY